MKAIKKSARFLLPLTFRKHLAIWINRQTWLDSKRRSWWITELIHDLSIRNENEYHKFLWSHHLSYAAPYEAAIVFGNENIKQSRKIFFADLKEQLIGQDIDPAKDVDSVFDVGCSLGYLLRYLEKEVFSAASVLDGVDIDKYAIQSGMEYLTQAGSKVRLSCADMEELGRFLGAKRYDITICLGVLMYLKEESAARVVDILLQHTNILLGFAGLAHPEIDNSLLEHSIPRESDNSFIHNIDSLIKKAGGEIVARRWEGAKLVDGHTIYFVFAKKTATC